MSYENTILKLIRITEKWITYLHTNGMIDAVPEVVKPENAKWMSNSLNDICNVLEV